MDHRIVTILCTYQLIYDAWLESWWWPEHPLAVFPALASAFHPIFVPRRSISSKRQQLLTAKHCWKVASFLKTLKEIKMIMTWCSNESDYWLLNEHHIIPWRKWLFSRNLSFSILLLVWLRHYWLGDCCQRCSIAPPSPSASIELYWGGLGPSSTLLTLISFYYGTSSWQTRSGIK